MSASCCATEEPTPDKPLAWHQTLDWMFWGSTALLILGLGFAFWADTATQHSIPKPWLAFGHACLHFAHAMWWSLLVAILALSMMNFIPAAMFERLLGRRDTVGGKITGVLRAMLAGAVLDLCSHGILMIGAKLYRNGASLGQVYAFLITSPWNSISTFLLLAALAGWVWALAFLGLSAVVGVIVGLLAEWAIACGWLPENPNRPGSANAADSDKNGLHGYDIRTLSGWGRALRDGVVESKMVLRWVFLGVVLASTIRALVPTELFADWFAPTLAGLGLTLLATTLLEVCSEGSSPIAADLLGRASAPGNAFAFLMAGVATDYTEVMVLRDTTGRWLTALALPLLTLPQVVLLAWWLNQLPRP